MSDRLPLTAEEIDPAWLDAVLAERHPGVAVASVEVVERHELTNAHARLAVAYHFDAGAPTTLFAKLPPSEPARRESIAATGMGRSEVRFYNNLAPHLALRVPEVHAAVHDDRDGSFVVLIEDLVRSGCTVSDGSVGVAPDAAATALAELADLHVRYEDPARLAAEAAWVQAPVWGSMYGATMLGYALEHHRDRISRDFAAIAEAYIARGPDLHELWHGAPSTVIHGDAHIGNLFDDQGRTGFLDWGLIKLSTPMRDVSYFLTMALSIDDRRAHETELLRVYLAARTALGGRCIGFDEAWSAHRLHAAYTVPASCQIVTFPDNQSEGRRVFSQAFLGRAEAAITDLDALGAIRDALP